MKQSHIKMFQTYNCNIFLLLSFQDLSKLLLIASMEHSLDDLVDLFFEKHANKEPNHLSSLVSVAFGSPQILLSKISQFKVENPLQNQSGFELKFIFKMYDNISLMELDSQVVSSMNSVLDALTGEQELKAFLKSSNQIKYFFIILLWKKLYTEPAFKTTLLKTIDLVRRAQYYNMIFVQCLQDIDEHFFRFIVESLNNLLSAVVGKFVQQNQNEENVKHLWLEAELFCSMLKHCYSSNRNKHRIPLQTFNNRVIAEDIEPLQQFKRHLRKIPHFNFIGYPFLLDSQYKYKIIQIQSIYQQKKNIRQKMQNGFSNIIQEVDLNHQFSIEGLIFMYFNVNRNNILDDSLEKLGKIKQNLKSPLKISFIGEEGADQGGVKNQYFQLVIKAIFNPYLDMFLPKNQGRYYWFNSHSFEPPIRFQFVGMILGLALYNSVHLDIHFPDITFKKLLSNNFQDEPSVQTVEDLKEIQPDIYRSLKDILTTSDNVDALELYFVIELQCFGEKYIEELCEDGSSIKLSDDNKEYYCMLYADYILNKSIVKQFTAFKRGFNRVVSGGIIQTFEPEELRALVGGIEEIDMQQLQESTQYEGGYSEETPIVKYFWEIIHSLNQEEKKNFLTFVTGTDRVPIEGLKSLNFLIQKHGDSSKLPSAHTCFNVFLLPEYESKEILDKKLRIILEHNQGFGLI